MKKSNEELIKICDIRIEKLIQWTPNGLGKSQKDLLWIATIKRGSQKEGWTTIFNAKTKRDFWRRLKEEI